eukprot:gnl/Hemi2/1736_TR615_c0_g2_i1.p1 gnl/Hemi2/1736_TR615_c0_g2~~gnl/Hemi2/1736_TR615_c0_g2_i1.p1  ORF type:complete len:651 (-),score=135.68 gnl/Hemi2/1736_TR615_c0_g2_i1:260-2212(-)
MWAATSARIVAQRLPLCSSSSTLQDRKRWKKSHALRQILFAATAQAGKQLYSTEAPPRRRGGAAGSRDSPEAERLEPQGSWLLLGAGLFAGACGLSELFSASANYLEDPTTFTALPTHDSSSAEPVSVGGFEWHVLRNLKAHCHLLDSNAFLEELEMLHLVVVGHHRLGSIEPLKGDFSVACMRPVQEWGEEEFERFETLLCGQAPQGLSLARQVLQSSAVLAVHRPQAVLLHNALGSTSPRLQRLRDICAVRGISIFETNTQNLLEHEKVHKNMSAAIESELIHRLLELDKSSFSGSVAGKAQNAQLYESAGWSRGWAAGLKLAALERDLLPKLQPPSSRSTRGLDLNILSHIDSRIPSFPPSTSSAPPHTPASKVRVLLVGEACRFANGLLDPTSRSASLLSPASSSSTSPNNTSSTNSSSSSSSTSGFSSGGGGGGGDGGGGSGLVTQQFSLEHTSVACCKDLQQLSSEDQEELELVLSGKIPWGTTARAASWWQFGVGAFSTLGAPSKQNAPNAVVLVEAPGAGGAAACQRLRAACEAAGVTLVSVPSSLALSAAPALAANLSELISARCQHDALQTFLAPETADRPSFLKSWEQGYRRGLEEGRRTTTTPPASPPTSPPTATSSRTESAADLLHPRPLPFSEPFH